VRSAAVLAGYALQMNLNSASLRRSSLQWLRLMMLAGLPGR
jgi:hypothetical protein